MTIARTKAWLLLPLIVAVALFAGHRYPAFAQAGGACLDQSLDQNTDLAKLIAACQKLIDSSATKVEERAEAYLRRGFAYGQKARQTQNKNDMERALADFLKAGELVPNNREVQTYILDARSSLLREVDPPAGTKAAKKAPPADEKTTMKAPPADAKAATKAPPAIDANAAEVERLKEELRKAQERLAALERAKPVPDAPPKAAPDTLPKDDDIDAVPRGGRIGVRARTVTREMADAAGLSEARGAMITAVRRGGAADEAGLRVGDVILAVDGRRIERAVDLRSEIADRQPGARASLSVMRDRRRITVQVVIEQPRGSPEARGEELGPR